MIRKYRQEDDNYTATNMYMQKIPKDDFRS